MAEQFEFSFGKKKGVSVRYRFQQNYLKDLVRRDIAGITGDPDLLSDDLNTPAVRKEIQEVLSGRGLNVEFKEDEVVIRTEEADIAGEYHEGWEKARRAG